MNNELELYFSITSSFLFLALKKNNKWIDSIKKDNFRLHSDNFITHLQQLLSKNDYTLPEVEYIYFTSYPGGCTGIRVSIAFITTYQTLNDKVKLFHINTLFFQANNNDCISLLTLDSRASKYYSAVYQDKKEIEKLAIIDKEKIKTLSQSFPNFVLRNDLISTDFLTCFDQLKKDFIYLNNIEQLNQENY